MLTRTGALLLAAATLAVPAAAADERRGPVDAAFVLLRDGRLVKVSIPRGVVRVRRLGTRRRLVQSGPLVITSGGLVYALLERAVVTVDARTLAVRRRIALPAGLRYRGLALAPRSARLYVTANRTVRVLDPATGLAEEDAVVVTISLQTGRRLAVRTVREAAGRSWYVVWASVSGDERRIAVAYHGGCDGEFDTCTTGADVVGIAGERLEPCRPPAETPAGAGCSPVVHGRVEPDGDGFLAATGSRELVRLDGGGTVVARFDSRLDGNHVMDFALARSQRTAYVAGSCVRATPGLTAVALATGRARVVVRTLARRPVCAERAAVTPAHVLALATWRSQFYPGFRDALVLVDGRSGRRLREVRFGAEPLDVTVGRG